MLCTSAGRPVKPRAWVPQGRLRPGRVASGHGSSRPGRELHGVARRLRWRPTVRTRARCRGSPCGRGMCRCEVSRRWAEGSTCRRFSAARPSSLQTDRVEGAVRGLGANQDVAVLGAIDRLRKSAKVSHMSEMKPYPEEGAVVAKAGQRLDRDADRPVGRVAGGECAGEEGCIRCRKVDHGRDHQREQRHGPAPEEWRRTSGSASSASPVSV